jgi:hypothetical protein
VIALLGSLCRRGRQLLLTTEAWWELARAAVVVRAAPRRGRTFHDLLRARPGGKPPREQDEVRRAVARAGRYHLKPMHCLERSLALVRMLRRRGATVALRIGCRRVGGAKEFHAWVVDGEGAVLGGTGYEDHYAALVPEPDCAGGAATLPRGQTP